MPTVNQFGGNNYGYPTPYGGLFPRPFISTIPITIDVFDISGRYKQTYQSGSCDLIEVQFSHAESGCKDFIISFGSIKNINKTDSLKVKIFTSYDYFFTGVVRVVPIPGSTSIQYVYTGFGWNDYFQRLNTGNLVLGGNSVNYIVKYLWTNVMKNNTQITWNSAKVDLLALTIATCNLSYVNLADALKDLKRIADSDGNYYRIGVDEAGDFFFKARSTDTKATLVVGKRGDNYIPKYEPKDNYEARTKYYIVRSDGTYYGTAVTSVSTNDIYEEKLSAPAGLSDADIALWASGQIKENEINQRTATVDWKIKTYNPTLLNGDGYIRIISNVPAKRAATIVVAPWNSGLWSGNGVWSGQQYQGYYIDDTLQIIEVKYTINAKQASRSITLGTRPVSMETEITLIRKKLTELSVNLGR